MAKDVVSVERGTPILDAAKVMEKYNISSVLIVDKGEPVGIVTERDLVRKVVIKKLNPTSKVEAIMSAPLVTIDAEDEVSAAAEVMMEKKIRRLPVVEKGKLVGIITETDISRTSPRAVSEFSSTVEKIDRILNNL